MYLYYLSPKCEYLLEWSFHTHLVPCFFTSGDLVFMAAMQGTPQSHLALEVRRTCVPESCRAGTFRDSVLGRLPLPGHFTDSRLKHTPVFLCLVALAWGASFWLAHLGSTELLSRNRGQWMQSLYSLSTSFQFASIFQKGTYELLQCPDCCHCCQGTPLHCLTLVDRGAYGPGFHRTVTNGERDFKQLPPWRRSKG